MEESARRFARRVLIAHVAALVVIVLLVFFAGREIYLSTRAQALVQVQRRQALLANQTARGIEAFYDSILNDLDLMQRAENETEPATRPARGEAEFGRPPRGEGEPTSRPARLEGEPTSRPNRLPRVGGGIPQMMFGRVLWRQIQQRANQLFLYDKNTEAAIPIGDSPSDDVSTADIVGRMKPWLKTVDKKLISGFQIFNGEGMNLVCIPADSHANHVLVAVVPVHKIEDKFLNKINADPTLGATLMDDSYRAMATSRRELIGVDMVAASPPDQQALIQSHAAAGEPFQLQLEDGAEIKGIKLPPAILAIEPIHLPGKQWWVYMALPLSEVDGALGRIFHRVIVWAIGVVVLMTAVLVSTSIQMIRGRIAVERVQHEILTRELEQARKIQLAWLPKGNAAHAQVDVAACNDPASHISGDFYNWFDLPDGRVVVTIGDVTGHGMSAAFLMATTQMLVRTTMLQSGDPGKALTEINRQLCQQVFNGQFVTMAILVIDPAEQVLDVSLAGHMAPLISDGGAFAPLPAEPQLVLGVEPAETYPTERYALQPESRLVLYTDGVIDALAPDGRRLGTKGLLGLLARPGHNASDLLGEIVNGIATFRGVRELADDLTLVAVHFAAAPAPVSSK